jgi:leader peptidase (prepilin peptidase)/N-methyltransferase
MSFPFAALATTIAAAPFIGCFGANAVRRSLEGKGFFFVRSCCDACGRQLELRDLVPILSWLLQVGRCRHCSASITRLYPAVEAAFLLMALWAAHSSPDHMFWPTVALGWTLVILIAFDVLAFILPNALTISLGAGGLLLAMGEGLGQLQESVLGLIAGGSSLLVVSLVYKRFRGREGLGLGDVKLFAATGAWVKLAGLPSVLLIGSLLGLLYALFILRRGLPDAALQKIPLGAGLCAGFWLTWIYGPVFDWTLYAIFGLGISP